MSDDTIDKRVDEMPEAVLCPDCANCTSDYCAEVVESDYAFFWWACDSCEHYIELEISLWEDQILLGTFCWTNYGDDCSASSYRGNNPDWYPSRDGKIPPEGLGASPHKPNP